MTHPRSRIRTGNSTRLGRSRGMGAQVSTAAAEKMVYPAARSTRVGGRGRGERARPPKNRIMLKCSNYCQPSTKFLQKTSLITPETPTGQQTQKGKIRHYIVNARSGLHPYWQITGITMFLFVFFLPYTKERAPKLYIDLLSRH